MDNNLKKGISIIVCCYNSKERLPETLRHLSRQKLKFNYPTELIIVDNNSSDNTAIIARERWNEFGTPFPLVVIEELNPGLANARRTGVLVAQFQYGIFCDDDNWLSENYLEISIQLLESNPNAAVFGGASVPVSDIDLPPWFFSKANSFAVGTQADEEGFITWKHYLWGAGMVFRLNLLKTMYESGVEPLVSGRKGGILSSGDDGEISAWFIFSGYQLYYSRKLLFKHYMPSMRLTDKYFNDFFKKNYKSEWSTYSEYLNVRYNIFFTGSSNSKSFLNIFKIIFSIGHLLMNLKSTIQIIKIDFKIKKAINLN
jgi:glycosyltransferase involved in cell wall biosynthesis